MWRFRRSSRRELDLESALRAARAEPRDEFVRQLSEEVRTKRSARRLEWSRLAFAGALSTLLLGTVASFGGFGYAASGASSTYRVVKQVVVQHKVSVSVHKSSAAAQYPKNPQPPQQVAPGTQANTAGVAASAQALPFTGFSLLATVLVSIALIIVGLVLRRRERDAS